MANLKQITRGIGKFRGGLANKSGKKLKVTEFQEIARPGLKTLTFTGMVASENPSKADPKSAKFAQQQQAKIKQLQAKLKDKTVKASEKKAIRLEIQRRRQNVKVNKGATDNAGSPNRKYKVSIIFSNVRFEDEKKGSATESAKVSGSNKLVFYTPPTPSSEIKLRCTCPDFRHSFSHQLANKNALAVSKPTSYFRVTPAKKGSLASPTTFERPARPKNPNPHGVDFVNPNNEMGFCKHVFRMLQVIKEKGKFKEK